MWKLEIQHPDSGWVAHAAYPTMAMARAHAHAMVVESGHYGWPEPRIVWSEDRPHGWAVYERSSATSRDKRRLLGVWADSTDALLVACRYPGRSAEEV